MAMTDTTPTTSATPATGKAALRAIAGEIAAQLGETDPEPQRLIVRALRLLGEEQVHAIVARALAVEAAGFRWGLLR